MFDTGLLIKSLFVLFASVAFSAVVTPFVRLIALKTDLVITPRKDRWHKKPTPTIGGVAIVFAFVFMFFTVFQFDKTMFPIVLGGILMFILGLADDLKGLSPQIKLIGQIAVAALVISFGTVIEIIPYPAVAIPLTLFWIIAMTNAFNLIDNMDGLSAGIATICALAFFVFSLQQENMPLALCSLMLAGACIGFLFYNFNPARIFMGDCGSMFLGFMFAVLSVAGTWKHASGIVVTFLVPVIILSIPIFDTAFVTVTRKFNGKPVSQGGRDHLSHRLVSLGISEKRAVLILYAISASCGLLALLYVSLRPGVFAVIGALSLMGLFFFCRFLGSQDKKSDKEAEAGDSVPIPFFRTDFAVENLKRMAEILIDLVLIVISYYTAYLIRFEGVMSAGPLNQFIQTLPFVMVVKITAFWYVGLYQTVWRHVGIRDFMNIIKAVLASSLIIITGILMFTRFEFFSRSVFVIDAMCTTLLICGAHFFMRVLKEYISDSAVADIKLLIIGAGDSGEMALRQLRQNHVFGFNVAGFIDDDSAKQRKVIHGVKVLGKTDDLLEVISRTRAQEVLIAIPSASSELVEQIELRCEKAAVRCRHFSEMFFNNGKNSNRLSVFRDQ